MNESNVIPFPKAKLEPGEDNDISRFFERYAARARRGEFTFAAVVATDKGGDAMSAWEIDPDSTVSRALTLGAGAYLMARLGDHALEGQGDEDEEDGGGDGA